MATEVILPMLGETMNEGTIVAWLKNEGDPVRPGEVLYTVESDKATLEVEATVAGYLRRILVPAGTTVPVLSVVAYITADPNEAIPQPSPPPAPGTASPKPPEAALQASAAPSPFPDSAGRIFASPRARRVARERGLDLSTLSGSGPSGRIVERDLERATPAPRLTPLAARKAADMKVDLSTLVGSGPGGRITTSDLEAAAAPAAPSPEPLSRVQRIMAERMVSSFTSAPHFYLHAEINARRLLALRQELLPVLETRTGLRLTVTDLLVALCARALQQHPRAMAQFTPQGLRPASGIHIGIATDTPGGLVVPVIHDADRLPLAELLRRRSELVDRARAGKSLPQDFEGGVFTLSNLGGFRIDSFDAILNPPQATLLAVGRISERPFVEDGQLRAVPTMKLSLSVDHRVLDGASASRFLEEIVRLLEAPAQVLV